MVAAILAALVALVVVAAIAVPLLSGRAQAPEPAAGGFDQDLADEIDRELQAIREIDFDHRAGNLSDADFAELDRAARATAAELIRRRDAVEGRNPPQSG